MWKKGRKTYEQTTFGLRLHETLKAKHMFQRELAQMANIQENTVGRYIYGTRIPNIITAKRIAEALGVSLDWLIGLNENVDNVCDNVDNLPLNG